MSRKRTLAATRTTSDKRRKVTNQGSTTYGTVPRTRGIYAIGEYKYFDTSVNGSVARSSNWTNCMADPSPMNTIFVPKQGAAINERIGREVTLHKIRIQGYFQLSSEDALDTDASIYAQVIRFLVVQDTQTNSTQMDSSDLMDGSSVNATVMAFQNLNNFGRFKVLKDKVFTLQDPNILADANDPTKKDCNGLVRTFKFVINFKKGVKVRFNATNDDTIASIIDNSFHLVANCRTWGAGDTNQPIVSLSYRTRCVYTDA